MEKSCYIKNLFKAKKIHFMSRFSLLIDGTAHLCNPRTCEVASPCQSKIAVLKKIAACEENETDQPPSPLLLLLLLLVLLLVLYVCLCVCHVCLCPFLYVCHWLGSGDYI